MQKKLLVDTEGRKEAEGRGRPSETEEKYMQEKLLGQNNKGRSLQRYMSLSLGSQTSLCKCRLQRTLCLLPECTENISGLGSVSPMDLYPSFPVAHPYGPHKGMPRASLHFASEALLPHLCCWKNPKIPRQECFRLSLRSRRLAEKWFLSHVWFWGFFFPY